MFRDDDDRVVDDYPARVLIGNSDESRLDHRFSCRVRGVHDQRLVSVLVS